jgi:DNA invertase Pin-like site-specific DNA recombinase
MDPRDALTGVGSQAKITAMHLERLAYIYVRQSSPKQVKHNQESQVLQYQLAQRAEALGWARERIRVIDTDQATSARSSTYRDGFQELVTEVSLGHVGILFGWQVSRVARNNTDWYTLLDLAALRNTLIADIDGVYDLRQYNDRLLLGLKGTISEAELYLLRQRLDAGRMSQVRRGAYRQHLPTGLVRLPDGAVVKDPDDQIRHAIELVFAKFEELGSCSKVMRYLRDAGVLLPRRQTAGLYKGQLLWKRPTHAAIYDMMRNPAYAGAFVYGRTQLDYTQHDPGRPATGRLKKPMPEWLHLQQDVYPAYISWEQYLANQEQLRQNAFDHKRQREGPQGAARRGSALLQGLAVCGHCGCRLSVAYKRRPLYQCEAKSRRYGGPNCLSVPGPPVEAVVVQAFFEAIQPARLDVLEAVLAEQQADHHRLAQQWQERLKRAQYEAQLAQRQYDAVDPDNRLVAAELERRWEARLLQLQETQEAYERFAQTAPQTGLAPELRAQLQNIAETLPDLWPQLANEPKKELLRSLIASVICTREAPDRVQVKVVWVSGHYSVYEVRTRALCQEEVTAHDAMVARIEELWRGGLDDAQIAAALTAEGFHSAHYEDHVAPLAVQNVRLERGWHLTLARSRNASKLDGYLTVRGLAEQLGYERSYVYRLIYSGKVDPRYVTRDPQSKVYLIEHDPEMLEALRARLPGKHHH